MWHEGRAIGNNVYDLTDLRFESSTSRSVKQTRYRLTNLNYRKSILINWTLWYIYCIMEIGIIIAGFSEQNLRILLSSNQMTWYFARSECINALKGCGWNQSVEYISKTRIDLIRLGFSYRHRIKLTYYEITFIDYSLVEEKLHYLLAKAIKFRRGILIY